MHKFPEFINLKFEIMVTGIKNLKMTTLKVKLILKSIKSEWVMVLGN
jgi:hypothetical protein